MLECLVKRGVDFAQQVIVHILISMISAENATLHELQFCLSLKTRQIAEDTNNFINNSAS